MTETAEKSEVEAVDEFELDLSSLALSKEHLATPDLIALVGGAGAGKTHSGLDLTKVDGMWPVLILDTEGSTIGVTQNFDSERFDVVPIKTHKQLEDIVKALTSKTHKYKTVVVDTIDTAQERALKKFEKDNPGDGFAKWGDVAEWLVGDDGLLNRLKRADFFSVVIVHTREEKSESGAITNKVKLQGSAKDNFASIPSAVFYQTRKMTKLADGTSAVQSKVYTVGTKAFDQAKNRFNLPYVLEDATLKDVFELIRKGSDKK